MNLRDLGVQVLWRSRKPESYRLNKPTTVAPKRYSETAGINDLRRVKIKITALVWDLRLFDVTTIRDWDDPEGDALATRVNTTLADLFGRKSEEYEECSISSFDTLKGAGPVSEMRQRYQKRINTAIQKLNVMRDILDNLMATTEEVTALARQAGATAASSSNEKISLVSLRAKLRPSDALSAGIVATPPDQRKLSKDKPEVGVPVRRAIDPQPGEAQPGEGAAGVRNRLSADITGKKKEKEHNQPEVDKTDLSPEKRKYEPLSAELKENLTLEYLEAMQSTWEARGLREENGAKDGPETAAVEADDQTPVDVAAAVIAADEFATVINRVERQGKEDEPVEEALVPVDESIVFGDAALPAMNAISTLTGEPVLFAAAEEGLDTAGHGETSAEILAEPYHEIADIDPVLSEPVEPEVLILPDIDLAPEMFRPQAVVEDRQETIPWSPDRQLTVEMSAEPLIEPSMALTSVEAEVGMAAGEKNDFQAGARSTYLDGERIEGIESGLLELSEAVSDAVQGGLAEEEPLSFEHGQFTHVTAEQMTEPVWYQTLSHEVLSVDRSIFEPERSDPRISVNAVEEDLRATVCREQSEEHISLDSLDMCDVEALADRFTREIAGEHDPKFRGASEACPALDAVSIPVALDPCNEETYREPAEDLVKAAEEPAVLEVEQNPFALRDSEKEQPRPKTTGAVDLHAQIAAIMERICDLKGFDVTTIEQRFDPRVQELRDSVNNTIADVFGRNTPAYWHHSLPCFDAFPVVLGRSKPSLAQLRANYKEGINRAVMELTAIMQSLKHRVGQSEFRDS